jgi:hypothetical protein
MAWTVSSNTFQPAGSNTVYGIWNGQADASALTDEIVFNCSDFVDKTGNAVTQIVVDYMRVSVSEGIHATVELDATTDILLMGCPSNTSKEYPPKNFPRDEMITGEVNTTDDAGTTGDIVLTTTTGAVGEGVTVEYIVSLKAAA